MREGAAHVAQTASARRAGEKQPGSSQRTSATRLPKRRQRRRSGRKSLTAAPFAPKVFQPLASLNALLQPSKVGKIKRQRLCSELMVQLYEMRLFSPMQILFWVFALVENPTYPCLHGVGWQLNVLSWLLVTYLPCWVSSVVTKHFVMEHRHQLKLVSVNCRCDQSVKANQLSGPPTDLKVMKQLCMAVFQNGNNKCSLLHFCRKVYIILTDVWFDKSAWLRIWPFQLYFCFLPKHNIQSNVTKALAAVEVFNVTILNCITDLRRTSEPFSHICPRLFCQTWGIIKDFTWCIH